MSLPSPPPRRQSSKSMKVVGRIDASITATETSVDTEDDDLDIDLDLDIDDLDDLEDGEDSYSPRPPPPPPPPRHFLCPISNTLLRDPVIDAEGSVYERTAILRWLVLFGGGWGISPITGNTLRISDLRDDDLLTRQIEKWGKERGHVGDEVSKGTYHNNDVSVSARSNIIEDYEDDNVDAVGGIRRGIFMGNDASPDGTTLNDEGTPSPSVSKKQSKVAEATSPTTTAINTSGNITKPPPPPPPPRMPLLLKDGASLKYALKVKSRSFTPIPPSDGGGPISKGVSASAFRPPPIAPTRHSLSRSNGEVTMKLSVHHRTLSDTSGGAKVPSPPLSSPAQRLQPRISSPSNENGHREHPLDCSKNSRTSSKTTSSAISSNTTGQLGQGFALMAPPPLLVSPPTSGHVKHVSNKERRISSNTSDKKMSFVRETSDSKMSLVSKMSDSKMSLVGKTLDSKMSLVSSSSLSMGQEEVALPPIGHVLMPKPRHNGWNAPLGVHKVICGPGHA